MKLHLPTSLRKALLACLAALVVPSFTMASGSALFGAALFSYLAATPVALADDVYITRSVYNGDVLEDPAAAREQMEMFYYHELNGPDLNTSEHTWIFDQSYPDSDQFYFGGGVGKTDEERKWTINANIRLDADIYIGNGYTHSNIQTFNGNFSGTGNMEMKWPKGDGQTWVFTGDLSKWSGSILAVDQSHFTVRFKNSAVSNTGGISLFHASTENTSKVEVINSTMNNEYIAVDGTLFVDGACTFNVQRIDVDTIQFADNETEEGNDTVVTFAGQNGKGSVSFDSMAAQWKANVTFAEGVDFTMNGALQLSTAANGSVTRTYDFGGEVRLKDLTVYGGDHEAETARVIFRKGARIDGNLTTGWESLIELGDDLEFTGSLVINAGNPSSTIRPLEGVQEGTVGVLFYTGAPDEGEEAVDVELTLDDYNSKYAGTLTNLTRGKSGANTLKFTDGGTIDYSFKVKEGSVLFTADTTISGWVSGDGTLEVGSGATLTLSDGGSFGAISGDGIFSVTHDTTLTDGGSVGELNFATNCTLTLGAELTVGHLTGTGTINYGGEEGGSTKLIISNQNQGDNTPRVENFRFGENVNLELNINKWATFHNGGSLNDVLITVGELDLQGVTVNGDVTMGSSGKRQLTIQVNETTFAKDVTIDTFVLRSGATATVQGNLSVTQGLEDDNYNGNTINVKKNLTVSPGQNVSKTYQRSLTVTGLFTKNGVGTQTLSGNVTLNGGLVVNAGTLTLSGTSNITDGLNVKGGTLELSGESTLSGDVIVTTGNLTLSGTSNVTDGLNVKGGTLELSGTVDLDGEIIVATGANLEVTDGTTTLSGTLDEDSTMVVSGGELVISGDAAGVVQMSGGALGRMTTTNAHISTLDITADSEDEVKIRTSVATEEGTTLITIDTLKVAEGKTAAMDHGSGYIYDKVTITNKLEAVDGNISAQRAHLTLAKGGTIGGNLSVDWSGRLILGDDLFIEGNFSMGDDTSIERMEGVEKDVYVIRSFTASNGQNDRMSWNDFNNKFGGLSRYSDHVGISVEVENGGTRFVDDAGDNRDGHRNTVLNQSLWIKSGTLALSIARSGWFSFEINGAITGDGNLEVWTEKYGQNNNTVTGLYVNGGGKLGGSLILCYWGARVALGSDFEVGGLTATDNEGNVGAIAPSTTDGVRHYCIDTTGEDSRTFTLNVADTSAEIDADVRDVEFHGNLTIKKIGEGTQRIIKGVFSGRDEDNVSISVQEGKLILDLENEAFNISGSLSIGPKGTLEIQNGSLDNATIGGNMNWDRDVDENLGILGVGGTLTVGSLVEAEDGSQVSRAGTQTLKVGTYGNDHYKQGTTNRFPLHDVVIQSGTLDIALNANGWEGDKRDDRNVQFEIGSITGQGEGATLRVTRASYTTYSNFWAVLLINGQATDVFQGTLEFKDAAENGTIGSTTGKVEVQIANNWTLGSIDVSHGAGAVTVGANGLTLNVLREICGEKDGDTAYQLNFLAGSSGSGRTSHTGTVNLQAGGTIAGILNLGSTIALNIGNGKTLSVGGLSGDGSAGMGVWTADGTNTGSATIEITGRDGILQKYDLSNVTLLVKSGAKQTLDGDGSETGTSAKLGLLQLENNAVLSYRTGDNMIRRIEQLNGGEGSLHVFGTLNLTIGGGTIGGDLRIGQDSRVFLNGDLTIGGLTADSTNTSAGFIKILENTGDAAWKKFYGEFEQHATAVTLTLDVNGKYTGSAAKEYRPAHGPKPGTVDEPQMMNIGSDQNARNANFTLKKTGEGEQKFIGVNISADVELNAGRLTFINGEGDTPMSTIWGDVRLGENGTGTLAIDGTQVKLAELSGAEQNKSTIGTLEVVGGGSVTLDRDLTVSNLIVDNNSANAFTHTGDPTTLTLNITTANVGPNMDAAPEAEGDWHLSLTGVKLVKTGAAEYTFRGLVTDSLVDVQQGTLTLGNSVLADVNIESGATLVARHAGASADTTNKNVINGELTGSGTLQVNSRTLEMTKAKSADFTKHGFTGILDMNWGGDLKLAADMQVSGLVSSRGQNRPLNLANTSVISALNGAEITFTLNVAEGAKDFADGGIGYLILESGVSLVKSGAGTQVLHDFGARELVTVSGGKLELAIGLWDDGTVDWTGNGTTKETSPFFVNSILVDGAELSISKTNWYGAKDDEGAGTTVTLTNGGTLSMAAVNSVKTLIELGTLALSATNAGDTAGKFVWSTRTTTDATEVVNIYKLTGTGSLILDEAGTATDASKGVKILDLKNIVDYTGSISYNGAAWSTDSALRVGTVKQSAESHQATITGIDVYSSAFRKLGAGSLTIDQDLYIDSYGAGGVGAVWMNYQGTLTINGALHIAGGSDLVYTLAEQGQVIEWAAEDLVSSGGVTVNVRDIIDNNASLLSRDYGGIDLGITGGDAYSLDTLAALISLSGQLDEAQFELRLDEESGHVYLIISEYELGEVPWDTKWGVENATSTTPTIGQMDTWAISKAQGNTVDGILSTNGGEFRDAALTLDGSLFAGTEDTGRIKLDKGGANGTAASIIGGWLIDEQADVPNGNQSRSVYIQLAPTAEATAAGKDNYHLLVGGSSVVYEGPVSAGARRFSGNTHIQMEGGKVDYIVGGNHVTNIAYGFTGNSFISVMGESTVRGGIVGGSTLTKGAAKNDDPNARDAIEFDGNSHIYIHTVLSHQGAAPSITTGTPGDHQSFNAVVGGNAWIELADTSAASNDPLFRGSSKIEIDLNDGEDTWGSVKAGSFDLAIVGGNYTAAFDGDSTQLRSSRFRKYGKVEFGATISINATDDVTFTAGVNGASRRASGGSGHTFFEGDTLVEINGGRYTDIVAGGFWFDQEANGDHSSELNGNTNVRISEGSLWRVVGGSVSLGGTSSSSTADGNAYVSITGGSFANKAGSGALTQGDIGFVAGGDFYKNTGTAVGHVRTGNTTLSITGGVFDDMHIVGGDYANFTGSADASGPVINGTSSVLIGGEDSAAVSISGLVVGGSYMTDEAGKGQMTINGATTDESGKKLATHIVIGENADLSKDSGTTGHSHSSVAIVAGHVVMDYSTAGNHTANIVGDTWIEVTSGSVTGDIVGGSYAGASSGVNVLSLTDGTARIDLMGGVVSGNIVGGHYSENTDTPDTLILGDVEITLDGAEVTNGNIIGGSHRSTTTAADTTPTQGNITINLLSGKLTGNVYAAGEHASSTLDSALQETTASTLVKVGESVIFGAESIISGGYLKNAPAMDNSGVQGDASLEIEGNGSNLSAVSFVDFDHVTTASDVVVGGSLTVMDRAANTGLVKAGAGKLTLQKGLLGAAGDYTGKLTLAEGSLSVGADLNLSKLSGLEIDLTGRQANSAATAWLTADGVASLLVDIAEGPTDVTFTNSSNKLEMGTYYLTGELSGLGIQNVDSFFNNLSAAALADWAGEDVSVDLEFRDGCLTLRVHNANPDVWYWEGGNSDEAQLWDDSGKNWSRDDTASLEKELADVHFNSGAANGNVGIKDTVTPGNVFIESGNFTFTQAVGEGGLEIGDSRPTTGVLYVGVGVNENNYAPDASLDLQLDNYKVPAVQINQGGTLTLSSEGAIQTGGTPAANTQIDFNGGLLVYGEAADGSLAFSADVSSQVTATAGSLSGRVDEWDPQNNNDGLIRVQIGNNVSPLSARATEGDTPVVVWNEASSNGADNYGIKRILEVGVEKSGRGDFIVKWADDSSLQYNKNIIRALEGKLVFEVTPTASTTINLGGQNIENSTIEVAENAAVQFIMTQGTMYIWRGFEGDGKVIIGGDSEVANNTSYMIIGDNRNFNGTIELVGDSEHGGCVTIRDLSVQETVNALHGKQLILSGRGFQIFSASSHFTVGMDIEVTEGTTNQVRHYNMNSRGYTDVTLEGKITGSGTLDDGRKALTSVTSSSVPVIEHRITGDITEFTGTLHTSTTDSKWNLGNGTAEAPDTIQANYDGTGLIIFSYADMVGATRLTGQFKDNVQLRHDAHGTLVLAAGADKMNYSRGSITLTHEDSLLHMGDADSAGTWTGGTVTGAGTMVLVNGRLLGGINTDGAKLTVETSDIRATSVNAGGTKGDRFSAITVNAGGHLSNVTGTINASDDMQVKLVLDKHNIGTQAGTKASDYLIEMQGSGSLVIDKDISGFTIDFTSYGLIETLVMMRDAEANGNDGQAYLHLLTGGSLVFQQDLEDILQLMANDAPSGYTGLLAALGFKLTPYQMNVGEMILTGSSKDVYLVLGEGDTKSDAQHVTSDNKDELEGKRATVIGPDATLDIELDGGDSTTVHNLVGVDGSTLHGRRKEGTEADGNVQIDLDNTTITDDIDDAGVSHGGVSKEQTRGQNTTFEGTIIGDEGVDFNKTGQGTLTVGRASDRKGGADIAGNLTLSQGGVCFEGDRSELGEESGNEIGALEFAYMDQAGEDEQRGFTFRNGTTTVHDIIETNDPAYDADNSIRLERNGKLAFAGTDVDGSTLNGTTFSSSDGTGILEVQEGDLTLKGGATNPRIDQVNVELNGGNLTLTDGATMKNGNLTVGEGSEMNVGTNAAVNGKTNVSITDGGRMTLADSAELNTTGQIEVQSGGNMTLERDAALLAKSGITVDGTLDLTTTQDSAINGLSGTGTISGNMAGLTLQGTDNSFGGTLDGSGTMKVNHSAALELDNVAGSGESGWNVDNEGKLVIDVTKGTPSKLGEVHMGAASDTTIKVNTDRKGNGSLNLGGLSWDVGASLTIESTGVGAFVGDSLDLGTIGNLQEGDPDLHLKGTAFLHYEAGELLKDKGGRLKVQLTEIRDNLFRGTNMSKNELAGADMFWNASSPNSGNWRALTNDLDTALNSDLYRMVSSLTAMVQSGETEGMGRTLAAGAGASISVLGSALAEDVQRQLRAIRNRTTTMTPEPRYDSYDEMPFYHVWANGEGSYHKLKADGMAPGYTLNSWGGTLGADADLSRNTTVGLALTAMYGDLKADAADSAKGDMDTYYVSAFARVAEGSWLHTFVMTGGLADVSLDRTVNYGNGSYTANGNTSGYSVAAMYEVGYAQMLNAEGSIILQSVANVTYRHSYLSGYTESGSDAGLSVGDISHDVVTLGAGARVQSAISHNAFNRTAILEGRALVKADIGDRSGKVTNQLINGDGTARELESAKVGAVGLELGVGVTIPVGAVGGTIFMDASLEFRRGYTSMDANVGYRYNF